MGDFLLALYPWTKALHIISVIAWMAGIFYLPRLFVYHTDASEEMGKTFEVMERRLLRAIMNPAMGLTWIFGLALVFTPGVVDLLGDHWFHVKSVMILLMTWFHHWLGRRRKEFSRGQNTRTARSYRLMNELPTAAMIVIVVMVVVRPF